MLPCNFVPYRSRIDDVRVIGHVAKRHLSMLDDFHDLPPGIDVPEATLPRCWPSTDACATDGEKRGETSICLDWANGRCARGVHCGSRHALPSIADENRMTFSADGLLRDVFGRPRAPANTFTPLSAFDPLACQTIHVVSGVPRGDLHVRRRIIDEALTEWGHIVKTWFIADEGSCFVKFKWRASAQVVMEALHGRPLRPEDNEPLQLAWAMVDPSIVQSQQGRELAYNAMKEARERGNATQALYERLERERHVASTASSSSALGTSALGKRARDNTTAPVISSLSAWHDGGDEPINAVAAAYPGAEAEDATAGEPAGSEEHATQPPPLEAMLPGGWRTGVDPTYHCTYYYHEASGRTQWEHPGTT